MADIAAQHRCCDEDGGRVGGLGLLEHLDRGIWVAADEAMKEGDRSCWHTTTLGPGADDALTAG